MIGQYLSNTDESATIPILQNFLKLNRTLFWQVLREPNRELGRCRPVSFAQNQKVLLSSTTEHGRQDDRSEGLGPLALCSHEKKEVM
jgi:hypothetical protein